MNLFKIKIISISTLVSILTLPRFLHAASETNILKHDGMLAKRWSVSALEDAFDESLCEAHLQIAIEGGGTNTRIRISHDPSDNTQPKPLYSHAIKEGSNLYERADGAIKVVQKLIDDGIKSIAPEHQWIRKEYVTTSAWVWQVLREVIISYS